MQGVGIAQSLGSWTRPLSNFLSFPSPIIVTILREYAATTRDCSESAHFSGTSSQVPKPTIDTVPLARVVMPHALSRPMRHPDGPGKVPLQYTVTPASDLGELPQHCDSLIPRRVLVSYHCSDALAVYRVTLCDYLVPSLYRRWIIIFSRHATIPWK